MRTAATWALTEVVQNGRSLSGIIPNYLTRLDNRDRALFQALLYGSLRHYRRLNAIVEALLSKSLRNKDSDVRHLLIIGLYQLEHMRVPDHAAVSSTVDALRGLKKPWAKGLINAVLRNFQRQRTELLAQIDADDGNRLSYPGWLIKQVKAAHPEQWQAILEAGNEQAPMTLRINRNHGERDNYLQQLAACELSAHACQHSVDGIRLEQATDVFNLPGFEAGHVSVQDEAAQLAAQLLAPVAGEHILDACAAPGGKTAHLLELSGGELDLIAIDSEESRLTRLHDTLTRLGYSAQVQAADASITDAWWDGRLFDRILLDAPCSASGVIRRHPDIKWLRRANDIDALATLQAKILDALWPTLKPGGMLLYATCSILPQENHAQIAAFLARTPDAHEEIIQAEWGIKSPHGRQILPGTNNMDGFYYARLTKTKP